jgi:sirohydrochlorin cobaltochelatase
MNLDIFRPGDGVPWYFGQLVILPQPDGFELRHRQDARRQFEELELHADPEAAAQLALFDDAGTYRPLKTAPNLRRGWRLRFVDERALRLALDLFYPGRFGAWRAFTGGTLAITPWRETLGRQSGMYRVAQKLTDEQSDALVASLCRSDGGCLRTILWQRDAAGNPASRGLPVEKFDPAHDQTGAGDRPFVPLLCQEACNLLVAAARGVVKGERSAAPEQN